MVATVPGWWYPGDIDEMDVMIWCADDRAIMVVDHHHHHGAVIDYDVLLRGGLP